MTQSVKNAAAEMSPPNDPRWQAITNSDPSPKENFFYSVNTTGIYCRPSCPARRARPEHVQFHATCEDAERAGYRPCKRCKPNESSSAEQRANTITQVCRLIENSETTPSLEDLARYAAMSPYHLHRLFKAITGVTPKAYGAAHRAARLQGALRRGRTVTEAIYDAGYNSNSRFYEKSQALLGMTASQFRGGGADIDIRFAIGECSLGSILVAASRRGVCAILLGDDPELLARDLQNRFPEANIIGGDGEFEGLIARLVGFVDDPARGLDLPLDIRGTAFQQRVWQALQKIPAGRTASYSEIARLIGIPNGARAVAGACAANPIAVAIPCHRVVHRDGSLSGYRWGVERKRALLAKERCLDSEENRSKNHVLTRRKARARH